MKAVPLVFRFRYWLHAIVFALSFSAPWNMGLHLDPPGPNAHVWGILAANLARIMGPGASSIASAFNVLLVIAILFAVAGAFLRTWGSAYLGARIVEDGGMHAGILTDGPFRYLRNPLYLGTFLHTLAISLLMPRSGAIFCILAIGLLQLRLIFAEEAFLKASLGAPYDAYRRLVPRLMPTLRSGARANGLVARWPQAILSEIYMWSVAACFAIAGWHYNAGLLIQCVVVCFGASLLVRAATPKSSV